MNLLGGSSDPKSSKANHHRGLTRTLARLAFFRSIWKGGAANTYSNSNYYGPRTLCSDGHLVR